MVRGRQQQQQQQQQQQTGQGCYVTTHVTGSLLCAQTDKDKL
jgi:hypothetical protein